MENKLAKKLLIKAGKKILLFNAPENYINLLQPLTPDIVIKFIPGKEAYDFIQMFVLNRDQLKRSMKTIQPYLQKDTMFWITFPKKASGIKTDLEMMASWDEVNSYRWSSVSAASIDEHWTALRFRPEEHVKKSDTSKAAVENSAVGAYVNSTNRTVDLPPGLSEAVNAKPAALKVFNGLSFSNKKEYVVWVMTAKQEKTRLERIEKTVEKLIAGKKNPAEK